MYLFDARARCTSHLPVVLKIPNIFPFCHLIFRWLLGSSVCYIPSTTGVSWGGRGGKEGTVAPPVFFIPKNVFLWLLNWSGANKETQTFHTPLFRWCEHRKKLKSYVQTYLPHLPNLIPS